MDKKVKLTYTDRMRKLDELSQLDHVDLKRRNESYGSDESYQMRMFHNKIVAEAYSKGFIGVTDTYMDGRKVITEFFENFEDMEKAPIIRDVNYSDADTCESLIEELERYINNGNKFP